MVPDLSRRKSQRLRAHIVVYDGGVEVMEGATAARWLRGLGGLLG